MKLIDVAAPVSLGELADLFAAGRSFVISGPAEKFADLLTLEEIEAKLNDGCNTARPVEVLEENGTRADLLTENLAWARQATKKRQLAAHLRDGHSFVMPNLSQVNERVARLIDDVERTVGNAHADLHVYVSPSASASRYPAHRDRPQHKLYLQAVGSSQWLLFRPKPDLADEVTWVAPEREDELLDVDAEFELAPGSVLYMPPGVFHRVSNPRGPRISLSIPFVIVDSQEDSKHMDRTYVPLREIFLANTGA